MHLYNNNVNLTALPPERVRRQFNNNQRAIVFVDGSNWYHKLQKLLGCKPPVDFHLRKFAENLMQSETLTDIRYYIGKVNRMNGNLKSERLYANQQKLFRHLQRQEDIKTIFGHVIMYPDQSFHEKGVDVRLAVDMIRLAIEDEYDVAYLLSSDTDLVPAVEECQRLDKTVVYVGSALHGSSRGLTSVCYGTKMIESKDVLPFLP